MKVKVKGLVFAGFAAAVFAQSAMADPTQQDVADMKTVTSKYYVDHTFQTLDNKATSIDTGNEGNGSSTTEYPTVGAVTGYAEALANKQTTIAATDNGDDTHYPTVNAVYDFVTSQVSGASGDYQPVISSASSGTAVQIGYKPSEGSATWGTLAGASGGYVEVSGSGGTYTVNIPSGKISDSVTTDASTNLVTENAVYDLVARETASNTTTINSTNAAASSGNELVPTVRNVYDYVEGRMTDATGIYQPKVGNAASVDNNGDSKVMVGYTQRSGESGSYTYTNEWAALTGDTYVDVFNNNGTPTVGIKSAKLGTASTDVANNGDKLMTGGGVYAYMGTVTNAATVSGNTTTAAGWATPSNETFPTTANVKQYVADTIAALPTSTAASTMPTECSASDATHYCALVAKYDANANGTGQGGIKYEWTVMAPTGN